MWLKSMSDKNFKTTKAFIKVSQIFELPFPSSSSGENKNLNFAGILNITRPTLFAFSIVEHYCFEIYISICGVIVYVIQI